MRCDVFRGIGGTAHKYYMLFQHHLPPPRSTYTTGKTKLLSSENRELTCVDHSPLSDATQGEDPNQLIDTFVAEMREEPMYIKGPKPGPYVAEHSFNILTTLGARIALLGIDARVEVGAVLDLRRQG